jgi:hypothetical protein
LPAPQTQVAPGGVSFNNIEAGTYTLNPIAPGPEWVLAQACWDNGSTSGTGLSAVIDPGTTHAWDIGYVQGTAWAQTSGADAYAAGNVESFIPAGITPREFNLQGTGGSPGIVLYGTGYDFDSDTGSLGPTLVSSTNWLANSTYSSIDLYDTFYRKFGAPSTTDNGLFADLSAVNQPASRATPYYITGDVTTNGNWSVADGDRIIFIIDGDLIIGGSINLAGPLNSGFIAFIVNGDIRVGSSVGGLFSSSTPTLEGVYITSPTGTFYSGNSGVGTERLVGKGMFLAGNFILERDLDSVSHNIDTSAELFTYNPQFLVTMPDEMRDAPVAWQEMEP